MPRFCCVQQSPQSVRDDRKRKNEEDVNDIFDVQNEAHVQNDATKVPPELFILISKYVFPKIRSLCYLLFSPWLPVCLPKIVIVIVFVKVDAANWWSNIGSF